MKETGRNALVGLFVLGSLASLATLMVMFGEKPTWLGGQQWNLKITGLREIRGINEGVAVFMNGVEIGRVERLEFRIPERPGLGVVVICKIKERYSVPARATAKLYGAALGFGTGSVHIVVDPNLDMAPLPKDGATIPGEAASLFGEIITKEFTDSFQRTVDHIGNLASRATPVMEHLDVLLQQRSIADVDKPQADVVANVSTMVERLDRFVADMDVVIGDKTVQEDVRAAVHDMKAAAENLRKTAETWNRESERLSANLNEGIDKTEANLDRSFERLSSVLENLDDSTKRLSVIMDGVAKGEGTAGMLARDPRLYEEAVLALQRLSDLLASIRRISGKIEQDGYITIGQSTGVGTFTKEFPVGEKAAAPR